jgi:site-specific DNA-methyltransferase (adenine-specific)
MTPRWAAQELLSEFFPGLDDDDCVVEPSCGDGAFLQAVPANVRAIGIEIDPLLAERARAMTGREVITGDFRTVGINVKPTVVLGNTPFNMRTFDEFLDRASRLLPDDGRCGFLLPAYALQTPSRVLRWNQTWGLQQTIVPRVLFPRLRLPLVFVLFDKKRRYRLTGFSLYKEAAEIQKTAGWARAVLTAGVPRVPVWQGLVGAALERLGGKATLQAIYREIEPHRPETNRFWQAKVRQVLQDYHVRVSRGVWAKATALCA